MCAPRGPADYTWKLNEVVRAYRLYVGLSRAAMAAKLDIAIRSYERIEDGTRACPPGFLDTMRKVANDFDDAVEVAVEHGAADPIVYPGERAEWTRSIAGRASVYDSRITPVMADRSDTTTTRPPRVS